MFDRLAGMGRAAWQLSDDELLDVIRDGQDVLNRVYGEHLEALGELQARGLTQTKGYASDARLLQDLLRITRGEANRRLAHATAVTEMQPVTGPALPPPLPATAEAVRAGAIGAEHVEAIHRAITGLPDHVDADERAQAEQTLVQAAHALDPGAIAALGRAIRARLDQDGPAPKDPDLRNPVNELRWHTRANGEIDFKGRLGVEGGALLKAVLSPLAKPRPAVDGKPDPRTRDERHGDALVDVLRLAMNSGDLPSEGGERPTLLVTVRLDDLRDQHTPDDQHEPTLLGDHTLIPASLARRLACDCNLIPAVLGSRSEPLDIGRKTRIVPTAMRRLLVLRDGGCAYPGCSTSPNWCDAHHCRAWADGGITALSNLVLLCGTHHALIHHSEWEVTITNGIPEFIPPAFLDPERRPRRNPIHRTTNDP